MNGDGRLDLLLHFRASEPKLGEMQLPAVSSVGRPAGNNPSEVEAVLYGETWSGDAIRGTDKITIIK